MTAALSGIRVIDLTTVVAGPSASQALADYGADVIKVEAPGGDTTRHTGPALEKGMASLFLGSNRNKRSIVLDLKRDDARAALLALIDSADVLLHNIRPQKLAALGIAPEGLIARNPRLIFVGLLGFGEGGPYAGRPAYDDIVQSLCGAADLSDRQLGRPRYMPTIIADKVAGQMATHATLAALFQRERSGEGQIIEVPMFEAMVQFLMIEHMNARHLMSPDNDGPAVRGELGYNRTLAEWRRPYRTSDGFVCVMPYNDRDWRGFFEASGRGELMDDPRFADITQRTRNIETLYRLLKEIIQTKPTDHWLQLCGRLQIACASVVPLEGLETDPHLQAVDLFGQLPAGDWTMRYVRSPVKMGASAVPARLPPRLGEHGREILKEIGYSVSQIDALLQHSR